VPSAEVVAGQTDVFVARPAVGGGADPDGARDSPKSVPSGIDGTHGNTTRSKPNRSRLDSGSAS
jgi:hypothetical protein